MRYFLNSFIFKTIFNPLDYDGSFFKEIKSAYQTNELGFAMGMTFFFALAWQFMNYRRNSLLESKKRFVY